MRAPRSSWPVVVLVLVGCGEAPAPPPAQPTAPPPPVPVTSSKPIPNQSAEPEIEQPANVESAAAGVGEKGRGYGGGILTEPIRQRFLIEHQLTFNSVKQVLDLYKAEHGRHPESHEAFMKEIIEANQIQLPELPAGDEYWYDPERGELMVRHPE